MRKMKRCLILLLELLKYAAAWVCGKVMGCFSKEYRDVWLFSERGREAKDNGYHLFAYISEKYPKINAWYVADETLPDFEKAAKAGKVIRYRSWKHYMMCAVSTMKISTHILGYTPDIDLYYMLDKMHVIFGKKVFLQHGISIDDRKWCHYPNVRVDLFVCSLQKEAEFVQKHYHHPEGVVQGLGSCRFDALLKPHETKRQILIMPTWRNYGVRQKERDEFLQTEYFFAWQELLKNRIFADMLEEFDYNAVFYPHFEVQKYADAFQTKSSRIQIAGIEGWDVQELLMESAVLVTDYSSVFFDFAYMKKQEIFYQFDRESWDAQHPGAYFRYEEDGFGPIAANCAELLQQIRKTLERDGALEEKYRERMENFLGTIEAGNCERNYRAILKLRGDK